MIVGDIFVYNDIKTGIFKGLYFPNVKSARTTISYNTDVNISVKYGDRVSFLTKSSYMDNNSSGLFKFGKEIILISDRQIEVLFLPLVEFRNNKIEEITNE